MRLPLHARFRYIRREVLGLSQEDLAKKLKVSRFTPMRWDTGKSVPDDENAAKLARLSGYPVEALQPEPETDWIARELAALRAEISQPGQPSREEVQLALADQLEQQAKLLAELTVVLSQLATAVLELRELVVELREATPQSAPAQRRRR